VTSREVLDVMGGVEALCKSKGPQGVDTLYTNCWLMLKNYLHTGLHSGITIQPYHEWLASFSAAALARRLGYSRSHAYRIQQGTMPSVTLAFAIMRESGYSLETILGGKPNE